MDTVDTDEWRLLAFGPSSGIPLVDFANPDECAGSSLLSVSYASNYVAVGGSAGLCLYKLSDVIEALETKKPIEADLVTKLDVLDPRHLVFLANGRQLAVYDGEFKIFELSEKVWRLSFSFAASNVREVRAMRNSQYFYYSAADGIYVFDGAPQKVDVLSCFAENENDELVVPQSVGLESDQVLHLDTFGPDLCAVVKAEDEHELRVRKGNSWLPVEDACAKVNEVPFYWFQLALPHFPRSDVHSFIAMCTQSTDYLIFSDSKLLLADESDRMPFTTSDEDIVVCGAALVPSSGVDVINPIRSISVASDLPLLLVLTQEGRLLAYHVVSLDAIRNGVKLLKPSSSDAANLSLRPSDKIEQLEEKLADAEEKLDNARAMNKTAANNDIEILDSELAKEEAAKEGDDDADSEITEETISSYKRPVDATSPDSALFSAVSAPGASILEYAAGEKAKKASSSGLERIQSKWGRSPILTEKLDSAEILREPEKEDPELDRSDEASVDGTRGGFGAEEHIRTFKHDEKLPEPKKEDIDVDASDDTDDKNDINPAPYSVRDLSAIGEHQAGATAGFTENIEASHYPDHSDLDLNSSRVAEVVEVKADADIRSVIAVGEGEETTRHSDGSSERILVAEAEIERLKNEIGRLHLKAREQADREAEKYSEELERERAAQHKREAQAREEGAAAERAKREHERKLEQERLRAEKAHHEQLRQENEERARVELAEKNRREEKLRLTVESHVSTTWVGNVPAYAVSLTESLLDNPLPSSLSPMDAAFAETNKILQTVDQNLMLLERCRDGDSRTDLDDLLQIIIPLRRELDSSLGNLEEAAKECSVLTSKLDVMNFQIQTADETELRPLPFEYGRLRAQIESKLRRLHEEIANFKQRKLLAQVGSVQYANFMVVIDTIDWRLKALQVLLELEEEPNSALPIARPHFVEQLLEGLQANESVIREI